ncbi:hypothetical protein MES5069_270052 [Mesorhizobium escarrei]|uniref:Uncharacterized protein n=1 Tax=Mesorhizobium escarrei TaxID=666018 RepID=A0ABM9DVQ2_9HYPH|nr:hypothetical protein MES5069_270052 [Mesorhizobium escarrei]
MRPRVLSLRFHGFTDREAQQTLPNPAEPVVRTFPS